MSRKVAVALGMLWMVVSGPAGCKQSEGDACQVNSDCKSGLVCCFDPLTGKGTCQEQCLAPDGGQQDAAPGDAAPVDAAPVDAAPVDAAPVDAAPVDAVAQDAAPLDAGLVDATVDATP